MGCSASTLVAAEPAPSAEHQQGKGDAPVLVVKRLGRGSLAGGYNRAEESKPEKSAAALAAGSGTVVTRNGTGRRVQVRYSYISQRGYYPDQPNKVNQDDVHVQEALRGDPCQHLFAVLDGHGEFGAECATFAKAKFAAVLAADAALAASPEAALRSAMLATNTELHKSLIDDTLSGTTACAVLLRGDTLHVANVGDSRAVLAEWRRPADGDAAGLAQPSLVAVPLSHDQTPFREDECQRVLKAGARVLTLDQVEGLKDADVRCWTTEESCDGDPPRLWAPSGTYPGTAFTRSIGDSVAEAIGVCADPELASHQVTHNHPFLVVATDGVWEFLSSQRVVDIAAACADPADAAKALVATAYKAWLQKETRTDDISAVVLYFTHPEQEATGAGEGAAVAP